MSSPITSTHSVIHFGDVAVYASTIRYAHLSNSGEIRITTKNGVSLNLPIAEEHQQEALKAIKRALEYHDRGKA